MAKPIEQSQGERAQVVVGYRRIYEAFGCTLEDLKEPVVPAEFVGQLSALVRISSKPQFPIWKSGVSKYAVRGSIARVTLEEQPIPDDTTTEERRPLFTEILCLQTIEVDPGLVALAFTQDDQQAKDRMLGLASEHATEFTNAADLVAGFIGLRFHRQLVMQVLNDNFIALHGGKYVMQLASGFFEVLDPWILSAADAQQMAEQVSVVESADDQTRQTHGLILNWLMRAWTERDTTNRFLAFFIPLEMLLAATSAKADATSGLQARQIRQLIRDHAGEQASILLGMFNQLTNGMRLPLNERFAQFAKSVHLPGWEADVAAFKRFYDMRNGLVHRGESHKVEFSVTVGDQDHRTLEDLTERYICFALFKSTDVYPSRWRPLRKGAMATT